MKFIPNEDETLLILHNTMPAGDLVMYETFVRGMVLTDIACPECSSYWVLIVKSILG